jgi:DNA-binding transcriptional MerR regulator
MSRVRGLLRIRLCGEERLVSGYRPREVATELGISTATLRSWSAQFADLLSASASPMRPQLGDTLEWRYTSHDIALLGVVYDLLKQGLTPQQVRAQLVGAQDNSGASQALTVTQEVGRALIEVVQTQRTTIAALEGQVDLLRAEVERLQIEQERQRARYLEIIRRLMHQQSTPSAEPSP